MGFQKRCCHSCYIDWAFYCAFFAFTLFSCTPHTDDNNPYYEQLLKETVKAYKDGNKGLAQHNVRSILDHGTPYYQYRAYGLKGGWCYLENKYDSNNLYIDSMLYIMEIFHLDKRHMAEYAGTLNSKGDHYYDENNLPKAFEYYSRSKIAGLDGHDRCALGNCSYHLGMVTYRQEKYAEAIRNFAESYTETDSCLDNEYRFYRKEELLNNIALAYTQQKQYDSAEAFYSKALNFSALESKRLNLPQILNFAERSAGVTYGNLAKIYIAQNRLDRAEKLLLQSVAINGRPGYDNGDAMYTAMQLAELYYNTSRFRQSLATLGDLKSALDTMPNTDVKARWLHLMYLFSKTSHDGTAALQYLESYASLKDSMEVASKKLKQTDYSLLFNVQESEYRIRLLNKDKQLDHLYLLLAYTNIIITVVIIILIYVSFRKSKKNVKTLTLLNRQVNEHRKQLEETLGLLQKSAQEKDRIMHVVAHDLRNPINGILSIGNLMFDDGLSADQKEYMDLMITASNNALTLISEILEFSGAGTQQEAMKDPVEVNELIRQVTGILKYKALDKNQSLDINLLPDAACILSAPGKIGRVLSNLIYNAVKFSPSGSVIHISAVQKRSTIVMEVKDHGIGIPEKYKSAIFQTFTVAKRHGTSGEISFGLGLSICKQIMEAHNGTIWFESMEGQGSSFFIELPVATCS